MPKPSVFLSYSHQDEDWKNRLRTQLRVLEQVGTFVVWDDRRIDAGDTWYDAIRVAMDDAEVAVCLISADYLASDFCVKEEIPYLLKRRTEQGMRLLPVLVRPCPWKFVPWLKAIQMLPRDGKTVAVDFAATWDVVFDEVAEMIGGWLQEEGGGGEEALRSFGRATGGAGGIFRSLPMAPESLDRLEPFLPSVRVDVSRLPDTGATVFGREAEIEWLDALWEDGTVRVASVVGPPGVGKTALIMRWIAAIEEEDGRGARRIFGWSFSGASADAFLREALAWFGDADPASGSRVDKGKRLAGLVAAERTILVLDDLESLQDPALAALLSELARAGGENRGLCILTSREPVTEIEALAEGAVARKELGRISAAAGRAMLRVVGGVRGTDAELEEAAQSVGGNPAALKRLASSLQGESLSRSGDEPTAPSQPSA